MVDTQRDPTRPGSPAGQQHDAPAQPLAIPEADDFWQGAQRGELRLQRCSVCKHAYFPPRPFCPACSSRAVESFTATGRATLYSFIISHVPTPGHTPPYSIAVVELEEGPRMMTNIVGCPQTSKALALDMPLQVVFRERGGATVPLFEPARSAP